MRARILLQMWWCSVLALYIFAVAGAVQAQADEAATSPAGLAMLVLFLGIGGLLGVMVLRWSQSTPDNEESA